MINTLLGVFDLEETSKKVAPYFSVFVFAILTYITRPVSWIFISLFVLSLIISVSSSILLRGDRGVADIIRFISKKEEDHKLAKKIGKQSLVGFLFRGVLGLLTFLMFFVSFIYVCIFFFKETPNILWLVLFIIGAFILVFTLILIISKSRRIKRTPKIIKSTTK